MFFTGRFLSQQALKPVSDLLDHVEEITAKNLDLRVNEGNGKDEIAELAITFNSMLNRLENSFDGQKQFVSSISHELRTPLAIMLGGTGIAKRTFRQGVPGLYSSCHGRWTEAGEVMQQFAGFCQGQL